MYVGILLHCVFFHLNKNSFSCIPAGTEETPMQSGHSEVCEIVTDLFLLAKKIYKKSSLLHACIK